MDGERRSLVAGNWKMELSHKGQVEVARTLKKLLASSSLPGVDVVVCPSYPALEEVSAELAKSDKIMVGAQNVHWEEKGPWTGAVSVAQVSSFIDWCIVGHSEVRKMYNLSEEQIIKTVEMLLQHGINPIVCLGETEDEREKDKTIEKVTEQTKALVNVLRRTSLPKIAVAYEPIWAIGTGNMPDPDDAASIILLVRKIMAAEFGSEASGRMKIIYGGSIKPATVGDYINEPGVDGVLVGNASVHPRDFVEIVERVSSASSMNITNSPS